MHINFVPARQDDDPVENSDSETDYILSDTCCSGIEAKHKDSTYM